MNQTERYMKKHTYYYKILDGGQIGIYKSSDDKKVNEVDTLLEARRLIDYLEERVSNYD